MNLRKATLRLAQTHAALREPLVRLLTAASWSKQEVMIKDYSRMEHAVPAEVMGHWAVHKSLGGKGWSVSHVPTGARIGGAASGKAAKSIVERILDSVPSLLMASESDLRQHRDTLTSAFSGMIPFESIMRREGLRNLGEMAGKHGSLWGVEGLSVRIRLGARDVVLMEWSGREDYGKIVGTWGAIGIEYQSKMTEATLKSWCDRVKASPTTLEIRAQLRGENRW